RYIGAYDGLFVPALGTPNAQKDRRKFREFAVHTGRQDFLVVVHVVAHGADDFFGLGNDRQVGDLGHSDVGSSPGDELVPACVVGAGDESGEGGMIGGRTEVDDAVFNDGASGFTPVEHERQ